MKKLLVSILLFLEIFNLIIIIKLIKKRDIAKYLIAVDAYDASSQTLYFKDKLFCGDTLFSCGCGRLFEGTYNDMHKALIKIRNLPKETIVYCAHEYTLDNIGFAKIVDPKNLDLLKREKEVKDLLKNGFYTIPSVLENELKINPFLRFDNTNIITAVQKHFNVTTNNEAEIFKYTREWKDNEYD